MFHMENIFEKRKKFQLSSVCRGDNSIANVNFKLLKEEKEKVSILILSTLLIHEIVKYPFLQSNCSVLLSFLNSKLLNTFVLVLT